MVLEWFQGWTEGLYPQEKQDIALILLAILFLVLIIYHACGSCKYSLQFKSDDDIVSEDMETVMTLWDPETTMIDLETKRLTLVRGDPSPVKTIESTNLKPKEEAEVKAMLQNSSIDKQGHRSFVDRINPWITQGNTASNATKENSDNEKESFNQPAIDQVETRTRTRKNTVEFNEESEQPRYQSVNDQLKKGTESGKSPAFVSEKSYQLNKGSTEYHVGKKCNHDNIKTAKLGEWQTGSETMMWRVLERRTDFAFDRDFC